MTELPPLQLLFALLLNYDTRTAHFSAAKGALFRGLSEHMRIYAHE